jgi:hypothetical protein
VNVGIDALGAVVASRVNYKAVVGVHISRLVDCMVAGTQTPGRVAPAVPAIAMRMVILWPWRQAKIHEVSDGRLSLAVVEGTHGELQQLATPFDL